MKRPEVVNKIRNTVQSFGSNVQTILYGSEARGDARPDSDIDLLILVDAEKLTIADKDKFVASLYDIELETQVSINSNIMLRKDWFNRPFRTPYFINVMNEGITL